MLVRCRGTPRFRGTFLPWGHLVSATIISLGYHHRPKDTPILWEHLPGFGQPAAPGHHYRPPRVFRLPALKLSILQDTIFLRKHPHIPGAPILTQTPVCWGTPATSWSVPIILRPPHCFGDLHTPRVCHDRGGTSHFRGLPYPKRTPYPCLSPDGGHAHTTNTPQRTPPPLSHHI